MGVVGPGARAAAAFADRGAIGVVATESTIDSGAYERAIRALLPAATVHSQACPLFVPLVEEGWADDPVAEMVARRYLEPLLQKGVRTLVLGCTHYPILSRVIEKVVGPQVLLVDSAETVAREVAGDLARANLLRLDPERPHHHFCVTDRSPRFARIARGLSITSTRSRCRWRSTRTSPSNGSRCRANLRFSTVDENAQLPRSSPRRRPGPVPSPPPRIRMGTGSPPSRG